MAHGCFAISAPKQCLDMFGLFVEHLQALHAVERLEAVSPKKTELGEILSECPTSRARALFEVRKAWPKTSEYACRDGDICFAGRAGSIEFLERLQGDGELYSAQPVEFVQIFLFTQHFGQSCSFAVAPGKLRVVAFSTMSPFNNNMAARNDNG